MSYLKSVVFLIFLSVNMFTHITEVMAIEGDSEENTKAYAEDIIKGEMKTDSEKGANLRSENIMKALKESENDLLMACPGLKRVNDNPRFFQMTIPNLSIKNLKSMDPSIIFGDLYQKIPPLKLNTELMELDLSKTINILSGQLRNFLSTFQEVKKNLKSKQNIELDSYKRADISKESSDTVSRSMLDLTEPLKDILALCELPLLDLPSLMLIQDENLWWNKTLEIGNINFISNQIRGLLTDLQRFLTSDYFQLLLSSKPSNIEKTLGSYLKELLDKTNFDLLSHPSTQEDSPEETLTSVKELNTNTLKDQEKKKIKLERSSFETLSNRVQTLLDFSKRKFILPTLNAQILERQGYITFKIVGQGNEKKAIVRYYNIPLINDTILDKFSSLESLSFNLNDDSKETSGNLEKSIDSIRKEIHELDKKIDNLKGEIDGTEKFSLTGSISSTTKDSQITDDRRSIITSPSGTAIDEKIRKVTKNLSNMLLKLQFAKFKLKISLRLKYLQNMDLETFSEGFYVLVPPKFGIDFKYPIKDLVKYLGFFSSTPMGTNKLVTWDKLPLRKSSGLPQKLLAEAKAAFERCQTRYGSSCAETDHGFGIFLESIRYCSFNKIHACINAAERNESKDIHNILVQYLQDQNNSDLETKKLGESNEAQKVQTFLSSNILQQDINNKQRYQSNLIWLIILLESLKREASFDKGGLQDSKKLQEHLEMILLDTAYRIKLVQENVGASFMNTKALKMLYTLLDKDIDYLATKTTTFSQRRESKDKTQILTLMDQLASMKINTNSLIDSNKSILTTSRSSSTASELRDRTRGIAATQDAQIEARKELLQVIPDASGMGASPMVQEE